MNSKDRFTQCIFPLMREFITGLMTEMKVHPEKPKYLLYGSFPGNEIFFQLLDKTIRRVFYPVLFVPVSSMTDIKDFTDIMDPTEEGYATCHEHFIWFHIEDEPSMEISDFNTSDSSIRKIWSKLDTRKDQTIRILVTCRCRSVSIFRMEKGWEHHFMTHGLWHVVDLSIDFAYSVSEEIMNRHYGCGQSRLKQYYKQFQKNVLSYERFTRKWLHSFYIYDLAKSLAGRLFRKDDD